MKKMKKIAQILNLFILDFLGISKKRNRPEAKDRYLMKKIRIPSGAGSHSYPGTPPAFFATFGCKIQKDPRE
jgi:hypothetical protein